MYPTILSWILRLWKLFWRRPLGPPEPVPSLPPGTAPSQAFGSVGPQATMMFPMSAMQATMAMPWIPSGPLPSMNVVPGMDESVISSAVDIGRGLRVEFRSSATATNSQDGTKVTGRVNILLVGENLEQSISDVSTSTPNSPATAVEWVASMVEQKLAALKIEVEPLDLAALEAAASKAYKDSLLHCVGAFASFFVHRVDHQDVCDVWKNAEIRYVMNQ